MNKVKEACEESDCKDKKKESEIDISMDDIEARRERVEKIQAIFSDIHYKTQEQKDAAILAFTKANLTIEEIAHMMAPGKPDYLAGQEYRKGVY